MPDGDEARRWAEEELSNPRYADAKPTWFDLVARDIGRFLADLFSSDNGANVGPSALIIVSVIIAAALIAALIIWGRPRSSRSIRRAHGDLLGAADDRTAAQLRSDAERAAREGDWDSATVLRYRAIARSLRERDLIDPAPGATAQGSPARPARCSRMRPRRCDAPPSPSTMSAISDITRRRRRIGISSTPTIGSADAAWKWCRREHHRQRAHAPAPPPPPTPNRSPPPNAARVARSPSSAGPSSRRSC
ncbi:hypothetical protein JM654_13460 [Microbacterium oxydans]|nr:hypothetical protein [Microbacterium oxydans]